MSAAVDNLTGKRLVADNGNLEFIDQYNINYLPDGTYFASIQAIDNTYVESIFSQEIMFVVNYNNPPTLKYEIGDMTVLTDITTNFNIAGDTFYDEDIQYGDFLTYTVTLDDGSQLPNWLTFNHSDKTFNAMPKQEDIGKINIKVTVTDLSNEEVSDIFELAVEKYVDINNITPNINISESGKRLYIY